MSFSRFYDYTLKPLLGLAFTLAFIFTAAVACDADAKILPHRHYHHKRHIHTARYLPELTPGNRYADIVVDGDSGQILRSQNSYDPRYPASLTKMMTLYLTFEALEQGRLGMYQKLPVSAHAAQMPETNIDLHPGQTITVREAILAMVVRSANDAAVVMAEKLGGSESNFASMMTRKAQQLGMKDTVFRNANGLPDYHQHTTARDMAMLGLALRHHYPQYFGFFSTESFAFRGRVYPGHNHVMERYAGVDGIKTGYTASSGFNLVSSAHRGSRSVIAVVMGGSTAYSRDNQMISLLNQAFNSRQMATNASVKQGGTNERVYGEGDTGEADSVLPSRKPLKLPTAATPRIQVATTQAPAKSPIAAIAPPPAHPAAMASAN